MFAFKRFVFGSRAMLATLGLSLCLGGSAFAQSLPVMLVDSGFSPTAGEVRLFQDQQMAAQVFTLEQQSAIIDIEVLVKPLAGQDHLTSYLCAVTASASTFTIDSVIGTFTTHLPPAAGAFVYRGIGFSNPDTLDAGDYAVVVTMSGEAPNTAGPSIGLTSIPAGPGGLATNPSLSNVPFSVSFVPFGTNSGLGIRVIGTPLTSKLAVSEGYVNVGDVPVGETRTLFFNISSLASDLLLSTQLPGSGPSEGGTLVDGAFSLPSAYSAALSAATSVQIQFTPVQEGAFESTLLLLNNDTALPLNDNTGQLGEARVLRIPLRGRGILANQVIALTQSALNLKLSPNGAVSGSLSLSNDIDGNSFSFSVETIVVGQTWLKAGITSGTVSKNGSVEIPLSFDATGLSDGTYTARLIFQSFNPAGKLELPVTLTVASSTDFDGLVRYYDTNAIGVGQVALVSAPSGPSGSTNTDGDFLLSGITDGQQLTLTFNKSVDLTSPGTPERAAILGSDAVTVLQKSAFATTVSADQALAGDINDDGHLDNSDALGILRYLAFFTNNIGNTGTWVFQPAQVEVTSGGTLPTPVRAFLLGDVDPSYGRVSSPVAAKLALNAGSSASIDITSAEWKGDRLVLPVRVAYGESISSLLLSLDYDATQLQFESAQVTTVAGKDYMMVENGEQPGKVHIAMAGLSKSLINEPLLEITFKVVGDVKTAERAEFLLSRFVINDLPMPVGPSSMLSIQRAPEAFVLAQNHPNPFNPETQIQFALPQAAQVRLSIYNLLGQEVRVLVNADLSAGFHKMVWDGRMADGSLAASGVYIYRIQTDNGFTDSKRMLLLK